MNIRKFDLKHPVEMCIPMPKILKTTIEFITGMSHMAVS